MHIIEITNSCSDHSSDTYGWTEPATATGTPVAVTKGSPHKAASHESFDVAIALLASKSWMTECNTITLEPFEDTFSTRLGCFYATAILSWGWGWVEVDFEAEVEMRLRWGWIELKLKLSWGWVDLGLR